MQKIIIICWFLLLAFSAKAQNYHTDVLVWDYYYCGVSIRIDTANQSYIRLSVGNSLVGFDTMPYVKFYIQNKKQKFKKVALNEDNEPFFVAIYPIKNDWDTINVRILFGKNKRKYHKMNIHFVRDIAPSVFIETMDSFQLSFKK